MEDDWIQHFTGEVDGRAVSAESYTGGGYRVQTTQLGDFAGSYFSDGSSTLIIPPSYTGLPISIEGETLDELREALERESFTRSGVEEIIGYFPA
ncbi:MAG: hypothetical protein DDT26_02718 [Dehalococcoidia bacterium]|nr:hypothetical protein [Chloroflexota bacterium]